MQQDTTSNKKIDWHIINGLRGLAALYVVFNHSRGQLFTDAVTYAEHVNPKSSWQWWEWLNMLLMQHTNLGAEFVILFFVLSGFSIAHSLRQNSEPKGFYLRRFIRLYPTYLIGILWAIVVFLIVKYMAPGIYYEAVETRLSMQEFFHNFIALPNMVKNLLYLPQNNFMTIQYWSFPLEVIFYLLAPFAIRKLRWYGIITVVLYLIGWYLRSYNYYHIHHEPIAFQFTFDYGIYFLVGITFYKYKDILLRTYKLNKAFIFISLFILFEVLVYTKSYIWAQEHNKITGLVMMLFSYIILFGFLKYDIHIKVLEKIGVYSYTLYVTHLATVHIVNSFTYYFGIGFYTIDNLFIWYIGVALSLLCAYLLYWVAERPSTKYLERLRAKR